MGLIQKPGIGERIRRAFGIREMGEFQSVSPEIVPVVLVEDVTGPTIDEGYPHECLAHVIAGQSAGVMAEIFLINPASSRVDLVVNEAWLNRPSLAGNCYMRTGAESLLNNLLGTQVDIVNMDRRLQLRPNGRVDSRNQAAAIAGDILLRNLWVDDVIYTILPLAITLPPGTFLSFHPSANNNSIYGTIWFTERLRGD